ncbi:MAG TPA: 3-deoxy-7-phosphoheptulonate synthase [Bacteroidales bacterium]|jgi:3-deoxy-7-phosphoheptulonate synthase|nr:3-deoxy-7-phosphoheptulonate synthase [Bacteroidales bacterium]HPB26154.1 3-deoxy-7-phosphoheptulonate synthase [Bacteroidales bacterium]HPI29468.1 3-deoxy-7-phosphoheptulonate synthase [Bacteroidales bacterium]HQN17295.1 3-deoxy-7-phosphoheptulonate synthase [Bacteroidales bacterium]
MILHTQKNISPEKLQQLADKYEAIVLQASDYNILITPSALKKTEEADKDFFTSSFVFDTDIQLASKKYIPEKRTIRIGENYIGGNTNNVFIAIGPCSVESENQITQSAEFIKKCGLKSMRGGCFKPRTSPYTFQGLGVKGLELLDKMRRLYGYTIITEVRDSSHVDDVIEYADIIQIGAKSMYDHGILRKCGKTQKPVLLKRGFGTTLQEFIQAAEFILSGGNPNVMLCERGIRTFETKTRFTLDLCGAAYLKENTNLPVILDPSHAMGYAYGVPDLARACMAMGVDGLLIEVHPNPSVALSDASQQLTHQQFEALFETLKPIAKAINRNII